jgi:acyl-CoA synthetase (AMP-forming)/AMP-acid ligase II
MADNPARSDRSVSSPAERLVGVWRSRDAAPWLLSPTGPSSYRELAEAVEAARAELRAAGARPGDRLLLSGDFELASVARLLAAAAEGLIVAPCVADLEPAAVEARRAVVEPEWSWTAARLDREPPSSAVHPLVVQLRAKGRAGLVLFSSGTSGAPKGMLHDLDTLLASYETQRPNALRTVATLVFDHIGGIDVLFRGLAAGSTLVAPAGRSPAAVAEAIERWRAEVLPASPTLLNLLLLSGEAERRDLSSLKVVAYGAEPMPASLLQRLAAALPGVSLQQRFGTSETSAVRVRSRSSDSLDMRIEDPDTEWQVVDGELWLRRPTTILGYLNHQTDRLTEDGWYRTGDLVEQNGEWLRIIGRREELINVGGEKVLPAEVESMLLTMPGVRDCRAFGEPNAITGQSVAAELELNAQISDLEALRAVRAFCRGRLERWKIPTRVRVVPQIATGPRGKKARTGG